jgi:hypothetical protein
VLYACFLLLTNSPEDLALSEPPTLALILLFALPLPRNYTSLISAKVLVRVLLKRRLFPLEFPWAPTSTERSSWSK